MTARSAYNKTAYAAVLHVSMFSNTFAKAKGCRKASAAAFRGGFEVIISEICFKQNGQIGAIRKT